MIKIGNTAVIISSSQVIKIVAVVMAAVCMSVVGFFRIAAMQGQLFLMAMAIFVLPLVSLLLGRFALTGLACTRDSSVAGSAGDDVLVTLTLENHGAFPKFYLHAMDRLTNWVHLSGDPAPPVLLVWPGKTEQITYTLQSEKRGVYKIGPVTVQSMDFLGFVSYRGVLRTTADLVVYPKPIPLRYVENLSEAHGPPAREMGAQRGIGGDFYGLRDYQCGDEMRFVHWPSSARLGKMLVIEQTQGTAKEIAVALDLNQQAYQDSGTGPESALEYAVIIAATLCEHYLNHGYALWFIADGASRRSVHGGDGQVRDIAHVLDHLARAEANSPRSFAEMIEGNRGFIPKGATLVTISARSNSGSPEPLPGGIETGREVIRFEIDGSSFRGHSHMRRGDKPGALPAIPVVSGSIRPTGRRAGGLIRRGDDLKDAIEGVLYASS